MFDHTMIFKGVSCIQIWCMSSSREPSPGAVFVRWCSPKKTALDWGPQFWLLQPCGIGSVWDWGIITTNYQYIYIYFLIWGYAWLLHLFWVVFPKSNVETWDHVSTSVNRAGFVWWTKIKTGLSSKALGQAGQAWMKTACFATCGNTY